MITITNELLEEVNLWCIQNRLQLNSSKTQLINFNLKNNICNFENDKAVFCDDADINFISSSKVLGVHIDKNMKWETHIGELCKKLSRALFVIKSLKLLVHPDVLKNCYFAYFHSLLIYGLEIWGHAPDYLFQKVFKLQKQAIRLLCNEHYRASCRELNLFEYINILPLPALYIYQITLFIKKNPQHFANSVQTHDHYTRNKNLYTPFKHRTTAYEKGPLYSGQKLFNSLPDQLKNVESLPLFKTYLKKFLFEKKIYSINEMC